MPGLMTNGQILEDGRYYTETLEDVGGENIIVAAEVRYDNNTVPLGFEGFAVSQVVALHPDAPKDAGDTSSGRAELLGDFAAREEHEAEQYAVKYPPQEDPVDYHYGVM